MIIDNDGFINMDVSNVHMSNIHDGIVPNNNKVLKRLHTWNSMPYKERIHMNTFNEINKICKSNNLSETLENHAKKIYMFYNKNKPTIIRGEARKFIIPGCLMLSFIKTSGRIDIIELTKFSNMIALYYGIDKADVAWGLLEVLKAYHNTKS